MSPNLVSAMLVVSLVIRPIWAAVLLGGLAYLVWELH